MAKQNPKNRPIPEGVETFGIRNVGKGKKFVVICAVCKKEKPSLTNNRCEECFNEWFNEGGGVINAPKSSKSAS